MWTIFLISSNLLKKKKAKIIFPIIYFFLFFLYTKAKITQEKENISGYILNIIIYNYIIIYFQANKMKQN